MSNIIVWGNSGIVDDWVGVAVGEGDGEGDGVGVGEGEGVGVIGCITTRII